MKDIGEAAHEASKEIMEMHLTTGDGRLTASKIYMLLQLAFTEGAKWHLNRVIEVLPTVGSKN